MTNLCQSCKDAAKKSIRILRALMDTKEICKSSGMKLFSQPIAVANSYSSRQARFGFFDLDAAFSAAFIVIMQAFLEGGSAGSCPTDLQEAIIVLEHLASEGNKVAQQRLTDIKEFSNQVLLAEEAGGTNAPRSMRLHHAGDESRVEITPRGRDQQAGGISNKTPDQSVPTYAGTPNGEKSGLGAVEHGVSESIGNVDLIGDVDFNLDWETAGIFSSYHDPRMPVTGVDQIDWEEMERMFAEREFH